MRILLVHPGASWSTADVEAGLRYGLEYHGAEVLRYRLDGRIARSSRWLHATWRHAKKKNAGLTKPTFADTLYHAGVGALERALRHQVDVVLVVSAMYLHPDVIILMKRAGLRVVVLFTESPYDIEAELKIAKLVDGCWTMEKSSGPAFRIANRNSGYLPHGWHPERHGTKSVAQKEDLPSHDVVFVGSSFRERVQWFTDINWSGIDLGIYGSWTTLGSRSKLRQYLRSGDTVPNDTAAELYRRAKIGLNLYRKSKGFGREAPFIQTADSMNPRAYELAACGAFHISERRAEVVETFGDLVPTFETPQQAEELIRYWLPRNEERQRIAEQLPACVAESSWVERATRVIGDLQVLLASEEGTAKAVVGG